MIKLAATIQDPEDWSERRLALMERFTRDKFRRNAELRERLQATKDQELINDLTNQAHAADAQFWGVVNKKGLNHLGVILMKVKQSIEDETELIDWVQLSFNLLTGRRQHMPTISIEVFKDEICIESIFLENKPFFIFGRHPKNDVVLMHESLSRQHAAFVLDKDEGALLIDLSSKAGTKVDG